MTSRVANKSEFYKEAKEIIIMSRGKGTPESIPKIGDLQGAVVSGNSAKGWAVVTYKVSRDGVNKVSESKRLLRTFRRLDGRWYSVDSSYG